VANHVFVDLSGAHLLLVVSGAATLIVLRSTADFGFRRGLMIFALALVSIVPIGCLLARLLIPEVRSRHERWALIVAIGYVASVLIGFFSGVVGLAYLYLPICIACLVWLGAMFIWRARQMRQEGGGIAQLLPFDRCVSKRVCVVASLSALGVLVSTPLMAPIQKVSPSLSYDYSFIDVYFLTARAQVLTRGAPPYTLADMAGTKPYVYPDFHLFWIGQLALWGRCDVNNVYLVYAPIVMIGLYTLVMYAAGKTLTDSSWGGYVGAALPYVLLVPNPYDAEGGITASLVHFLDIRANTTLGVTGMLIAAITVALSLSLRNSYGRRTVIGLLVVAGTCTVVMLRLRPHFFFALLPWYGIFSLMQAWRRRDGTFVVPMIIAGLLFALLYLESTSSHYDMTSTRLALDYGLFSRLALQWLPPPLQVQLGRIPALVQPLAVSAAFTLLRLVGLAFTLLLAAYAIAIPTRRLRLSLVETCLILVWGTAVAASSVVILEARREAGGDWGLQALVISMPLTAILVIRPAHHLLRAFASSLPGLMARRETIAVGVLALATLVTYRAAATELHSQLSRAYPITAEEFGGYYWLMTNTPETAIVAAHPDHLVNTWETVATTNFLSGQTRRPAYLQRVSAYGHEEVTRRRDILVRLFEGETEGAVQAALDKATFDYLLVYPDRTPRTDLSCCLTLVYKARNGGIKVYRHDPHLNSQRIGSNQLTQDPSLSELKVPAPTAPR
jgi:hypothetical protein